MARKRSRHRSASSDDSDEIFDEVDRFHMERDDFLDTKESHSRKRYDDILNVEGEVTDEDDSSEMEEDTDLDSNDEVEQQLGQTLPSANKWGKKRSGYYNTSFVDGDWGGMNDEDAELAELEEEDATSRQRKLDAALASLDYNEEKEDEKEDKHKRPAKAAVSSLKETPEKDDLELFLKRNPEFEKILEEYSKKRILLNEKIMPLLEIASENDSEGKTILERQLVASASVLHSYLINILFYVHLKTTSVINKDESKRYLDDHPVIDFMIAEQKNVAQVEEFMENNEKDLKRLIKNAKKGVSLCRVFEESGIADDMLCKKNIKENAEFPMYASREILAASEERENAEHDEDDMKRAVSAQIEKNTGLAKKRKKGTQHSRVKKRKQYDKALIRKRSQRPEVRRELVPYGGEARGIRASTVKSIRLKA